MKEIYYFERFGNVGTYFISFLFSQNIPELLIGQISWIWGNSKKNNIWSIAWSEIKTE